MELRPLALAYLETGPLYGYQLVQRARVQGKLKWEEGTIYPLLHKMRKEGLLGSEWRKAPNGKRRKYYSITKKGKKSLAKARLEWRERVRVVSKIMGVGHEQA